MDRCVQRESEPRSDTGCRCDEKKSQMAREYKSQRVEKGAARIESTAIKRAREREGARRVVLYNLVIIYARLSICTSRS